MTAPTTRNLLRHVQRHGCLQRHPLQSGSARLTVASQQQTLPLTTSQQQPHHSVHTRRGADAQQYSKFTKSKTVSIVGAPLAKGQPLLGVDLGPDVIRGAGLVKRLEKDHWKVNDRGNVDFTAALKTPSDAKQHKRALNAYTVGQANKLLYETCHSVHSDGNVCLTLGGDHSIAIGSLSGALKARPDTGIIWVDAHGDINTPQTSDSGNIHGMVFSFLMNASKVRTDVPYFDWMDKEKIPLFDPRNNLVYIGLRDVDEGEKKLIQQYGIKAYSMHEIDKHGISKVMEMALDHVLNRVERPIHMSFDIDSVDPTFAPSTGTRVAGGLTYREAYYICESVAETGCVSSVDLAEVNPSLNPSGSDATVNMANGLIASALGNTIL